MSRTQKIPDYSSSQRQSVDNNQAYKIICEAKINYPPIASQKKPEEPNVFKENIITVFDRLTLNPVMMIIG